jgi:hypothetical protein
VDPVFPPPWAHASSVHNHGAGFSPGLDAGNLKSGASSSPWVPALGNVVASSSHDGQLRSPVRKPPELVSAGTDPDARGYDSHYSPQSIVAVTSTPALGVDEGQLHGQSRPEVQVEAGRCRGRR